MDREEMEKILGRKREKTASDRSRFQMKLQMAANAFADAEYYAQFCKSADDDGCGSQLIEIISTMCASDSHWNRYRRLWGYAEKVSCSSRSLEASILNHMEICIAHSLALAAINEFLIGRMFPEKK